MPDLIYEATLRDKEVLASLKRIDRNLENLAKTGDRIFKGLGSSAGTSATKIGLSVNAIDLLKDAILAMGQAAGRAFAQVIGGSVSLARDLETTSATLKGIFQGAEEPALAALERIRKSSRELGVDLGELASSFLPQVSSLDQFERVAKQAAALALAQPEQGQIGARIALQEALSGSLRSLQQRFEIPAEAIRSIKETQEELGNTEGLIVGLDRILKDMGRDLENLGGTFQSSLNRGQVAAEQLGAAFGTPITESLKQEMGELVDVIGENFDDFEGLATLAGEIFASLADSIDASGIAEFFAENEQELAEFLTALRQLADIIGEVISAGLSGVLESIDVSALTDAVENINKIALGFEAIVAITPDFSRSGEEADTFFQKVISRGPGMAVLIEAWERLDEVIVTALQAWAIGSAFAAKGQAVLNNVTQQAAVALGLMEESQVRLIDPQEAFNQVMFNAVDAIDEYKSKVADLGREVENATIPIKESTEAGEEQADAFLRQKQAAKAAAEAAKELAEAEETVQDAFDKLDTESAEKEIDRLAAAEKRAADEALKNARKREDIARADARKIEDILGKHGDRVAKESVTLDVDQASLAKDQAAERASTERDLANKRVDILTNFRRRVEEINQRANQQARSAARTRDASAFLRIREQQGVDIAGAGRGRDLALGDLETEGERRRDTLREQQRIEREEQNVANEQKLTDLDAQLTKELNAQRLANDRAIEDQNLVEERKNADLEQKRLEAEAAEKLRFERKKAKLEASLSDELAIIASGEGSKREQYLQTAAVAEQAAARVEAAAAAAAKASQSFNPANAGFSGSNPSTILAGLRHGGPAQAGKPFLVGEGGPELFVPNATGRIIPNNQLPQNLPMLTRTTNNSTSVDNSIRASMSLLDPAAQTAEMRAITRNEILKAFKEVFRSRP